MKIVLSLTVAVASMIGSAAGAATATATDRDFVAKVSQGGTSRERVREQLVRARAALG